MFNFNIKSWWGGDAYKKQVIEQAHAAMREAAEFMANRARAYCPVDTGELIRSIEVIAASGSKDVHVVATAYYAQYVEFGSLHGGTWIPPNPFMRRALADTRSAFPSIVKHAMVSRPGGVSDVGNLGTTFTT